MRRLLRVELRRLWARRVTRWASVGVVLVVALAGLVAFQAATPPSDAQVAEATQYYESDAKSFDDEYLADCQAEQEDLPEDEQYDCEQDRPQLEWYLPPTSTFVPTAAELKLRADAAEEAEQAGEEADDPTMYPQADPGVAEVQDSVWNNSAGLGGLTAFSYLLLGLVLVVGVSFVTAEVNSGSLGMWLTFEPRRQRVYWSKAAAAALGTVPLVLVGFVLLVGVTYGAYAAFDGLGEVTSEVWGAIASFTWRFVLAGAAVAVIGLALGILLRHAAAAIGVVVAAVGGTALFSVQLGGLARWVPMTNLDAWLADGATYSSEVCTRSAEGMYECQYTEHLVSGAQGGLLILGVALVLTLVAVLSFRRRDLA